MFGYISTRLSKDKSIEKTGGHSQELVRRNALLAFEANLSSLQDIAGNRAVVELVGASVKPNQFDTNLGGGVNPNPITTALNLIGASKGRTIDRTIGDWAESQTGLSLGKVYLHDDLRTQLAATKLGTHAFSRGKHIYLGPTVGTSLGPTKEATLQHEIIHTAQVQRGLSTGKVSPTNLVEQEAEKLSSQTALAGELSHGASAEEIYGMPGSAEFMAYELQQWHRQWRKKQIMDRRQKKIESGALSYSQHCGWIDWGHANPEAAEGFIAKIREGSRQLSEPQKAPSKQKKPLDITLPPIASHLHKSLKWAPVTSVILTIRLFRPLKSNIEVLGVALGAFMLASTLFEHYQGYLDWLKNLVGMPSSLFAEEDLPSNLIGFYRAAYKFSRKDVEQFCKVSNEEGSKQALKGYTFQPNPTFVPKRLPAGGSWPSVFSYISPILPLPNVCSPYNVWESVKAKVQAGGGPVFYVIKPVLSENPIEGSPIKPYIYIPPPLGDFPVPKTEKVLASV